MSFDDVLTGAEKSTEEEQMYKEIHKYGMFDKVTDSFEETGYVKNIEPMFDEEGHPVTVILFEYEKQKGKTKSFQTNKEKQFFENCSDVKVFLSGIICNAETETFPKLYISACYSIESRENIINTCETLTEEEKRSFQRKIRFFSPEQRKDLAEKCVELSGRNVSEESEESSAAYINMEEMAVLYDIQKCMIPIEFRTEYNKCKHMMDQRLSATEKQHCTKVISNILRIDWVNQYYKEIDIDAVINRISSNHVGHAMQIEELRTQLLICNTTHKAPKTLSLIGRSCGCGSLAKEFAEAIGLKYAEIDLTGRKSTETDYLSGTSRIYENGRCGLIFEKIMEVGTHGLLIIKNIDMYETTTLDFITTVIEKKIYTDTFMEIPMDLSDLWVICTSSSTKKLPMSLRKNTHEICFEKINEKQRIKVINEVILPKICKEYNIALNNTLSEEVCRILIYQLSHNENKKLEMNLEALVVKVRAMGKREFPLISTTDLKEYFQLTDNAERMLAEYSTDAGEMENKYYCNYDMYPGLIQERVTELLDDIRYGDAKRTESYAIRSLRYLVNITKGKPVHYENGKVERRLKQSRFGQDDLASQVDDALLAEYLSGTEKHMTVLGLWGPPGTGKTTAAEAIANALGRGYIKINFGGACDASIIKGRNKSVPNAGPSLLISELARKTGTYSYVVNFDEFDKGTVESYEAFHEFLDPASNCCYDEYLECNIPKNDFLIILTFNDISKIPTPILDRMRLITVSGYSMTEKRMIVKNAVLDKYMNLLKLENVFVTDEAMDLLMREYSITPGIRDAEKDVEKLLIRLIKTGKKRTGFCITEDIVREILGSKRTWGLNDMGNKKAVPGQALALAVSGHMGSCIAIQVVQDPYQKTPVEVSGLLKGSCLESLSDAMSYVRRTLNRELPKLHISFRNPSIAKDGASAGLAMYMAIMSCMLSRILDRCAFTGTIDAFGNVGIVRVEEKLSAAERAGIERVYIPQDNYEQLKENRMIERYRVEIKPVSHVDELNREFFDLEV